MRNALIFFLLPVLLWGTTFEPIEKKTFSLATMEWYHIQNLQIVSQKNALYLKLQEEKPASDLNQDLFLDFESEKPLLKNYQITYENYIPNAFQTKSSKKSAKFFTKNHSLRLLPKSTAILRPGSILGSFTIEFWAYFYQIYEGQSIAEFMGNNLGEEKDQNNYGLSISIKNNRLTYRFENFFWDGDESYSFEITEDHPIALNKWEHHAVSFNILDGKLATYREGIEQQIIWVTRNRRPRSPILIPMVKEEVPASLTLGRGGFFSLDNFAILSIYKDEYNIQNYHQKPAEMITTVQKMPFLFEIKGLEILSKNPEEPFLLKIAYRISNQPFSPSDTTLPWVYLPAKANEFPSEMRVGKYIQFKIQYFPYEKNQTTPLLSSLSLQYTIYEKPITPIILSSEAGDGTITLSWLPSPEENLIGYEIYYGERSQEYDGISSQAGPSPIFLPYKQQGKLQPITYTLTGLANDRAYFVSVRAVDKWGQKSEFSQEIVLLPSDIHKTPRYSVK
ncbi:fibronectin type III domain-containing protein [Thermospira aquatica]|uniref:Fibronectin type III domain-containing protein n=1 Tax=Thermospira aquatica TaxID=2828656 RepID=A0AAX3BG48_9SPIR|nr:fibronectin type III domain-containing protein [Thermospira aquatica]URA11163.1 fibronectin type III domain-containing protein [Thermospira aquatica]